LTGFSQLLCLRWSSSADGAYRDQSNRLAFSNTPLLRQ
jgi:hypothetical protein